MPKPNSIFKASTDKVILTRIMLSTLIDQDRFNRLKKSFSKTVRNDPHFYDSLEMDIETKEILIGEPVSSYSEFDLFLACIAEHLEPAVIQFQDLTSMELLGLIAEDGKLYEAEMSVNIIVGSEIVMNYGNW